MQWISSPWALWPKNSIEILPKFDCQPMFFILFFILIAVLQLPILINLLLYFLTTITISSKQKNSKWQNRVNDFLREKQTIQYNNNNKIKYKRILYSIVHNNHIESRKNIPSLKANLKLLLLYKIVLLLYYYCLLPKYPPIILPTILYFSDNFNVKFKMKLNSQWPIATNMFGETELSILRIKSIKTKSSNLVKKIVVLLYDNNLMIDFVCEWDDLNFY